MVFTVANGMLRSSVSFSHSSGFTAREVKYIAKSAAKNINSDANQITVPTDTMFGRFAGPDGRDVWVTVAVATCLFWH